MNPNTLHNTPVLATGRRAALLAGFDNKVEVLVRIQAPAAPQGHVTERPPYGLALVIDRSGSMAGQPLAEAMRCANFVIDRLRPDDQVALVEFDNRVHLLCPARPRGDGQALREAIAAIHSGGNTNLHGGWRAGADSLAGIAMGTNNAGLKRVILLSDGCANEGVVDLAEIAKQCADLASKGVTTSTYGLGRDFNEQLMIDMAQAAQGNHYYGETADDLMEPFQQELALIENLCIKGLRVNVNVPTGVAVEMLNPFTGNATDGWRLPDLAWGAEAWAVLRLRIPKALAPTEGKSLHFLEVTASGQDLDGAPVPLAPALLALPAFGPAALAAVAEDELVLRRLSELEAAQLLIEARAAAGTGNWNGVDALLAKAEARFANNPWVAGVIEAIRKLAARRSREEFMKEAMYSSSNLMRRLAQRGEGLGLSESDKPAYLRRKMAQGKSQFAPTPPSADPDAGKPGGAA